MAAAAMEAREARLAAAAREEGKSAESEAQPAEASVVVWQAAEMEEVATAMAEAAMVV